MVAFTDADLDRFVTEGFLKIEQAFPRETGDRIRDLLWRQIGLSPDRPEDWTKPVVWAAPDPAGRGPFGEAMRAPALAEALDLVAGKDGWAPRGTIGNTPVRFPHPDDAGDTGWHIDQNDPGPDGAWGRSFSRPARCSCWRCCRRSVPATRPPASGSAPISTRSASWNRTASRGWSSSPPARCWTRRARTAPRHSPRDCPAMSTCAIRTSSTPLSLITAPGRASCPRCRSSWPSR